MSTLADLEASRSKLMQQFLTLGDFRPGAVSALALRCGKPACHCAQPASSGPPQFRLLCKVKGKDVSESFADPAVFRRAAEQVAEFHRFQALTAELTAINEQICRLRPPEHREAGWMEAGEKRLHQEVAREVQTLLQVVLGGQRKGGTDLKAVESATRASVLRAGAAALICLLAAPGTQAPRVDCSRCGGVARYHDRRLRFCFYVARPSHLFHLPPGRGSR